MERLVPHHSSFPDFSLSHFKLGFDQAENHTFPFKKPKKVRKEFFNGDEGGIDDNQIRFFLYFFPGEIPYVSSLQADHPRVFLKPPCQLSISNIHRVNLLRPFLKNTICEPSRGSPHVHDNHSLRIYAKGLEGSLYLFSPPTHIGRTPFLKVDRGVYVYLNPGLGHRLSLDNDF